MKINSTLKLFLVALLFGLFITMGTFFITQKTLKPRSVTGDVIHSANHGYPLSYFNDYSYRNLRMCENPGCTESKAYKVYWLNAFGDIVVWSGLSRVVLGLVHKARAKYI